MTSRRLHALGAAILVLAAALRLDALGGRDLWVDEAVSWIFARASFAELVDFLRRDSGPPLYYLLLGAWTRLVGDGAAALRALSAVAGVGMVGAVFWVGRRLGGAPLALAAALVAAVSPIQVYFSQQARYYALLSLLALAASALFLAWLESGRRLHLALGTGAMVAALYTHNYALFLVPTLAAAALAARLPRRRLLELGAALGAALLAWAPWWPIVEAQRGGGLSPWMRLVWDDGGAFGVLASSVASFAPGGGQPRYVALASFEWSVAAIGLTVALLVLGLLACARDLAADTSTTSQRVGATWLLAYAVLPTLLVWLVSLVGEPIYLPARLDQLVLPAWCLLAARGALLFRSATVRVPLLAAFVATALLAHGLQERVPATDGEHALLAALEARLEPGDAVVATSLSWAPLRHGLRKRVDGKPADGERADIRLLAYPPEIAVHPGHLDLDVLLADRDARRREAEGLLREIFDDPAWSGRLVLVFVPDKVDQILLDAILAGPRRRDAVLGDFTLSRLAQPMRLFLLDYGGGGARR